MATSMLETSAENSDELFSFMLDDLINLSIDINQELANSLILKSEPGVSVREKGIVNNSKPTQFEAVISFRIVKRVHSVSRDWMMKHEMGFRSSGTTIFVEAQSEEGEALFMQLQKNFDSKFDKLLFE